MPYQSPSQPLCRCCGEPIPKHTVTVFVETRHSSNHSSIQHVEGPLFSKADCQSKTNHKVMAVRYNGEYHMVDGRKTISYFTTWDGESYRDEFFCKDPCAIRFAYVMARAGRVTNLYNEAMARQK